MSDDLDSLFTELITQQRAKVLTEARRRDARLSEDEIDQPHDVPALANDPLWQYEDGVLAGYRAAHMAVRALLRRRS